jgi:hypothetical protein
MSNGAGERFTENHAFPSSRDIFLHQNSEFPPSRVATTSLHVFAFNCCVAELSPLSKYAPSKDDCQRADMLRQVPTLVEVLLRGSQAFGSLHRPECADWTYLDRGHY